MKAKKLAAPPPDMRTEWRRLNDVIDDMDAASQVTSSHSQLIQFTRTASGGIVLDCSGLIQVLAQKGIDLTVL